MLGTATAQVTTEAPSVALSTRLSTHCLRGTLELLGIFMKLLLPATSQITTDAANSQKTTTRDRTHPQQKSNKLTPFSARFVPSGRFLLSASAFWVTTAEGFHGESRFRMGTMLLWRVLMKNVLISEEKVALG